jgi:PAS domain S-box-containing protein
MTIDALCSAETGAARAHDPAGRAFSFLATAGEILASSLDYEQTLQHVARLAVPELGDLCIVDVIEDGRLRRLATAHVNPDKLFLLQEMARRFAITPDSPAPAARVLADGRSELLPEVTADVIAAHTINAEHARLIREIGICSHLAVPMIARGGIIGVISIGITESARQYDQRDLALAEELARRAAFAVDNARLYRLAQDELAERRRTEEALRLSEGRFRAIMEQSPLSMQILAPDGSTRQVNAAWEALWGLTADDIRGYNVLDDPQLEAHGITSLLRHALAGQPTRLPPILYDLAEAGLVAGREQGPTRWVSAFAYPVKDDRGEVCEVVLVHQDVTEPRRAELKLHASEERLRVALAAGRMNVWEWDLATDVVECSENALEFWGMRIGHADDFLAFVHPDDIDQLREVGRAAIAGEAPYLAEYRLLARDGSVRWLQSRGQLERAADGKVQRMLGVTIDITGLKLAQQASSVLADVGETLGSSLDYVATLADLSRAVVPRLADWFAIDLLTDDDSLERVCVNHSDPARIALAQQLFKRFPARRDGTRGAWHVIASGEVEWVDNISDELLEGVAINAEHLSLLRGLGLRSYICVPLEARGTTIGVLTLVHAESGRRYGAADVSLAVDLARRAAAAVDNSRLYQQLQLEDRRKDEFLATLAHELRNPLAPIRNGLELLRAAPGPEVEEKVRGIMQRQLAHLVRLVDDLLDLSRVTRGTVELERQRMDVASVVGSAIEASRPLIDAAGMVLTVELPEAPILVDADRTRLSQVVSNLLNNATKFSDAGGLIRLQVSGGGTHVDIQVSDEGIGIEPGMLKEIFVMFSQVGDSRTRSPDGLGIGLTLVRRLVELHGGRVWAQSDGLGHGSCFTVRLPRVEPVPIAPTPMPVAAGIAHESCRKRVLVVDDNIDAAETLAALLSIEGHEVRTAASGADALELVREFIPQVAFLDIGLPVMSGYELALHLRAQPHLAHATLVALTGWGQEADRQRSRAAGLDHHLTKPVDPQELLAFLATPTGA